MSNFTYALEIACRIHRDQTDKADAEYIFHCLAVAAMVDTTEEKIVAVLHDALEDLEGTPMELLALKDLIQREFGQRVFEAVSALTKMPRGTESYDEYLDRVAANYIARKVKIADLTHNMDPRRIPSYQIVDTDFRRWDKYRKALIRLQRQD